ncbi:MAG: ferredoxin [Rhodoferax sp.]|nr:ferredoxin [Rhodoferax sp.]
MCVGPRCTENGLQAQAMFELMGQKIDALPELRVKRTRTHCMVACRNQGPIVVVYPEGVWYNRVDESAVERIVVEHLEGGCPVSELIFHRLGEGDTGALENEDA